MESLNNQIVLAINSDTLNKILVIFLQNNTVYDKFTFVVLNKTFKIVKMIIA